MTIIITVIDVIRAVSLYMAEHFPQYPIDDRDISDTVDRPCTFIDVDDMQSDMYAVNYIRDTATIDIYIFVETLQKGFLELLNTKNALLQWLNNPLEVKAIEGDILGYVTPSEVNAEISKADKALHVSFNIELIQEIVDTTDTNLDDMEELSYVFKEVN